MVQAVLCVCVFEGVVVVCVCGGGGVLWLFVV